MFARPATRSQRLIAAGMVLYGLLALLAGRGVYTSATYTVVFDLARHIGNPLTVWGIVFVLAGVAGFAWGDAGRFLMIGTLASWSIGLWSAVLTGQASTWGGPIWPTLVVALLLMHSGRSTVQ